MTPVERAQRDLRRLAEQEEWMTLTVRALRRDVLPDDVRERILRDYERLWPGVTALRGGA